MSATITRNNIFKKLKFPMQEQLISWLHEVLALSGGERGTLNAGQVIALKRNYTT